MLYTSKHPKALIIPNTVNTNLLLETSTNTIPDKIVFLSIKIEKIPLKEAGSSEIFRVSVNFYLDPQRF